MQSGLDAIHAANAEVIAICVDSVEENAGVVKKLGLEFPILSDPGLSAIDAYDLRHENAVIQGQHIARPGVFLIDRDGVVRWTELTENYRVRVRPEQVIEQLLAIP